MSRVRWTAHALATLAEREIDREQAGRTLREPEATMPGHGGRKVYLRRYSDATLGQDMLLCVVTEMDGEERVVVTPYKTSKFAKYLQGTGP